jgi:hypothetical protein
MSAPRVFISIGARYTPQQERFLDELESFLRDRCGCDPRIIGKNEYPDGNPLTHIRDVMLSCHGVLVVAFERTRVVSGTEKPGGNGERSVSDAAYTTPWNHIESAIAFGLKMPMYILCENGLKEEGLIESKLDWRVQHIELTKKDLERVEVSESLRAWVTKRVVPYSNSPRAAKALLGSLKLSEMTPKEIGILIGSLTAAFLAGAAFFKWLPKLFS